jgi:hypothetical protein
MRRRWQSSIGAARAGLGLGHCLTEALDFLHAVGKSRSGKHKRYGARPSSDQLVLFLSDSGD